MVHSKLFTPSMPEPVWIKIQYNHLNRNIRQYSFKWLLFELPSRWQAACRTHPAKLDVDHNFLNKLLLPCKKMTGALDEQDAAERRGTQH
jgi:hypothetical protein